MAIPLKSSADQSLRCWLLFFFSYIKKKKKKQKSLCITQLRSKRFANRPSRSPASLWPTKTRRTQPSPHPPTLPSCAKNPKPTLPPHQPHRATSLSSFKLSDLHPATPRLSISLRALRRALRTQTARRALPIASRKTATLSTTIPSLQLPLFPPSFPLSFLPRAARFPSSCRSPLNALSPRSLRRPNRTWNPLILPMTPPP